MTERPATTGSARPPLRVGAFIGQAGQGWSEMLERVQAVEEAGWHHAYLVDHLLDTEGPAHLETPILEAWTLLAALAARTRRIRLGVLVTSNTFRQPALLAKQAATVDAVSGGRLILGLGTGWYEDEHRRFGIPLPPPAERVEALGEALTIIRRLFSGEHVSFDGQHYRLDAAPLRPLPVQDRVPILVAAHRPRMLRLAARHADIWDTFPTLERSATEGIETELAERIAAFERACGEARRDSSAVRRSTWTGGEAAESVAAARDWAASMIALGFDDLNFGLPARVDPAVLRTIASELVPELDRERRARGR